VMMGGRSAEEVVFGEVSTGAQNDLQKATDLARRMVTEFGMSRELGPLAYGRDETIPWAPETAGRAAWSEQTAREVDGAVRALVEEAHNRAVALLTEQRQALEAIAAALREQEVIGEEELMAVLTEHGIDVPPPGAGPTGPPDPEPAAAPKETASGPDTSEQTTTP